MTANARAQEPLPRLAHASLLLRPPDYERHFQQSQTFQQTSSIVDVWRVSTVLTAATMCLRWNKQYSIDGGRNFRRWLGIVFIVECVAQLLWMRWRQSYWRYRGTIYIAGRLLRLLHLCSGPYFTHLTLSRTPPTPPLPRPPFPPTTVALPRPDAEMADAIMRSFSTPLDHPLFTTTKLILLTSGAMHAFIPAITTPLPFLLQLPLQLITTLILLAFQVDPATRLLTRMLQASGQQRQICHSLNQFVYLVEYLHVGWASAAAGTFDPLCDRHATRLLVVVSIVYIGFAVPVYFSYRLERYMKVLYLQREHRQRLQPPVPLATEVLLLGMGVLVVWVLVLQWHEEQGSLPDDY